ncbi:MAG: alpha/beta fold hydrolase [Halobacteriaceae archaeon]
MRFRRLVYGVGGFLGGVVLYNSFLKYKTEPLPNPLPGQNHEYSWRGLTIPYTVAGDKNNPDVLLLHGIHAAASSHEFYKLWPKLTDNYHVIAPDLPGFGRSSRPKIPYTSQMYQEFLDDFVQDNEQVKNPICIATSLTGGYIASLASENLFQRLILIAPITNTQNHAPWIATLLEQPIIGRQLFNLLVSRGSLRWFNAREAFQFAENIESIYIDYQWQTAHQSGARFAPAAFIRGALDLSENLQNVLSDVSVPVTLLWGAEATTPPLSTGRQVAKATDSKLVVVDDTRLLPHVEYPDAVIEGLSADLPELNNPQ